MKRPKHKSSKIRQRAAANALAVKHHAELLHAEQLANEYANKLFSPIFSSLGMSAYVSSSFVTPPIHLSLQRNPRHPKCIY